MSKNTMVSRMQQRRVAMASAPTGTVEHRAQPAAGFAAVLKQAAQGSGWDPGEVWLTRVHAPRVSRRNG